MSIFSKTLDARIEINAPVTLVWQVLTNFAGYQHWNPYVVKASGELKVGGRINAVLHQPRRGLIPMHTTIVTLTPNAELHWVGRMGLPGTFTGNHHFLLQADGPDRTIFTQHEDYAGLLIPFLKDMLERDTLAGFVLMNEAIKREAEKAPSVGPCVVCS